MTQIVWITLAAIMTIAFICNAVRKVINAQNKHDFQFDNDAVHIK